MEDILNFKTVKEYNAFNNCPTLHPLVSIVDLEKAAPRKHRRLRYDFFIIFLKKIHCGDLRYGLNNYDYEEGTLIFLAPGQVIGQNSEEFYQPQGLALAFHPDLILGTSLGKNISDYLFFSMRLTKLCTCLKKKGRLSAIAFLKLNMSCNSRLTSTASN